MLMRMSSLQGCEMGRGAWSVERAERQEPERESEPKVELSGQPINSQRTGAEARGRRADLQFERSLKLGHLRHKRKIEKNDWS